MIKSQKEEEEKKMERLREAARKKGKISEETMQRKISETWKTIPKNIQVPVQKTEEDARRRELRNVKENIWKKWRTCREKERNKEKDEIEINRLETLKEKLDN